MVSGFPFSEDPTGTTIRLDLTDSRFVEFGARRKTLVSLGQPGVGSAARSETLIQAFPGFGFGIRRGTWRPSGSVIGGSSLL